jgi:hypothetical protein
MIRLLNSARSLLGPIAAALALLVAGSRAQAQTATNITGLYYTGLTSSGALAAAGTQAADWTVSYASINGGSSTDTAYEGAAYVISPASIAGSGYTPNTSGAQWITAPGAAQSASGNSPNTGGDFLPGNGNTGSNEGIYVYTLSFNITGTGSAGTVVNSANSQIKITMTMAADDQYAVYVNPVQFGTGTAAATQTNAWNNTTQFALQNYGSGGADNSTFLIGTNTIAVAVYNTNSQTGSSGSTALNASGLLVYQTSAAMINGAPVPEVATWLPLLGVIGCYGLVSLRRRQAKVLPVAV